MKLISEASSPVGNSLNVGKELNVVPFHKKESKNLVKNYGLVSLPIFGKILERVIFKDLFSSFHQNELIIKCQSGFLHGDSCVSQLSIVHDINTSFDCHPAEDVSNIFLNVSKAFDEVWHEGLLCKLETYCVKGEVLNLLYNYLFNCYQKSHSYWADLLRVDKIWSTTRIYQTTFNTVGNLLLTEHLYLHMFLINTYHSVN